MSPALYECGAFIIMAKENENVYITPGPKSISKVKVDMSGDVNYMFEITPDRNSPDGYNSGQDSAFWTALVIADHIHGPGNARLFACAARQNKALETLVAELQALDNPQWPNSMYRAIKEACKVLDDALHMPIKQ